MKGSMFMKAAGIVAAVALLSVGCQKAEEPKPAVVEEAPTTPPPAPPAPAVDSAAIKDSIAKAEAAAKEAEAAAAKKMTPAKKTTKVVAPAAPKVEGTATEVQIRKSR